MGVYLNNSKINDFGYFKHILGLEIGQRFIHYRIFPNILFNHIIKKTLQEKIDE